MSFELSIPTPNGQRKTSVESGSSMIFVGANGSGKTRLAAYIEDQHILNAHRISAHRAQTLNPWVAKVTKEQAEAALYTDLGAVYDDYPGDKMRLRRDQRRDNRWHRQPPTALLNDFDPLVQALFADQAYTTLATHKKVRAGLSDPVAPTKFERLVEIWHRLLPHRELEISADNIEVSILESSNRYNASEMSDGERAVFYVIGQTLAARDNTLLIFDEPELHIHRSIMAKLWDELEAARPDCAFIFITHDLDFAASRVAQKFVLRDYDPAPCWTIEPVPEDSGFDEETTTLIIGSRRPILFVEGTETSLDVAIYRCCYPEWTVIPIGSCENVIHSVVTMRKNQTLTRVTCSGIVDADAREAEDIADLKKLGIAVLPVSEIENLILLPDVSQAIAESEGYKGKELEERLSDLKVAIFNELNSEKAIKSVILGYCRRRIDRELKKIDLAGNTVTKIKDKYNQQIRKIDIDNIVEKFEVHIREVFQDRDLVRLLEIYDNKGKIIDLAAKYLKNQKTEDFKSWLTRVLRNQSIPELTKTISSHLPTIEPK